jgi:hypothetical protein
MADNNQHNNFKLTRWVFRIHVLSASHGTSGTILWPYAMLRTIRRTQDTQGINLVSGIAIAVYLVSA